MTPELIERGASTPTSDATLVRLAGGFIAGKRSDQTRAGYKQDLRQFFAWCRAMEIDPLGETIVRTHLELYARHMEDRQLSPSTRQRRIGTVRGWYEWLVDNNLFDRPNPVRNVAQPASTPVTERPILTKREIHILLKAAEAEGPAAWAMVSLCYVNGLRVGEATATNIGDIGRVSWHHTLRIHGKGEKYDEVALQPAVVAALEAATAGRESGPLMIAPTTGNRMTRRQFTRILTHLCLANDITRISPHALRRTAITLLLQEGVALREVQIFARHSSPRQTAKYDVRARSLDEHQGTTLLRIAA